MARVLAAMSGGIDSSVCTHLLLEAGHEVAGATMVLHDGPDAPDVARDLADAAAVAAALGIDHRVLDWRAQFEELVIGDFARTYESGRTPNPCFTCNRTVKFGLLLDYAREQGFDYLATGHYARVSHGEHGERHGLHRAADLAKDQSYFLAGLSQSQLAGTLFPLGGLTKPEVRAIAERLGLSNAHKRESQDICFVPDGDYLAFLERLHGGPYPSGPFATVEGHVVGEHRGLPAYTVGQRKGLGVALGAPMFVCAKDPATNTVTLGGPDDLLARACVVERWNWIADPRYVAEKPSAVQVKTHYRQMPQPATIVPLEGSSVRIEFDEPVRAIAPGQAAAAYRGDSVVGGGTISEALRRTGARESGPEDRGR